MVPTLDGDEIFKEMQRKRKREGVSEREREKESGTHYSSSSI